MAAKIEFDEEKLEDLIAVKTAAKDFEDFKKSFTAYRLGMETRQRETENEYIALKNECATLAKADEQSKKKIDELEKLLLNIAKAGWKIGGYVLAGVGFATYLGVNAFKWFAESANRKIFDKFFEHFGS